MKFLIKFFRWDNPSTELMMKGNNDDGIVGMKYIMYCLVPKIYYSFGLDMIELTNEDYFVYHLVFGI